MRLVRTLCFAKVAQGCPTDGAHSDGKLNDAHGVSYKDGMMELPQFSD